MEFTYLGTAAAEGFPAVFCNCEYCNNARKLGGRNIRTRSQAIINDDLLIDLPADTYGHFLANAIIGDKIKYLFITHSHGDHLYPKELLMHHGAYARNMQEPVLKVFCSDGAYQRISNEVEAIVGFELNLVKPYDRIGLDGYEIIPLPAKHYEGDGAVIYIIKGEKTILYAHDTGHFYDEVFEYIQKEKLYFDFISMDCTNVDIPISDSGSHMGIPNIQRVIDKLCQISAVDDNTIKYINHFSHNANPVQELLEERVKDLGYKVAFDGLKITL